MAQNFVYDGITAAETVRDIGLSGVPKMGFMEGIRNRIFLFDNLLRKSGDKSDVLYIKPFSGKVFVDSGSDQLDWHGFGIQPGASYTPVDASGFGVYAVDPLLNVYRWAKKVTLGEKNADEIGARFAEEVAGRFGKVAVVDYSSSPSQNGLFSIYFPYVKDGFLSETISRSEGESAFKVDLENALERALKLCK